VAAPAVLLTGLVVLGVVGAVHKQVEVLFLDKDIKVEMAAVVLFHLLVEVAVVLLPLVEMEIMRHQLAVTEALVLLQQLLVLVLHEQVAVAALLKEMAQAELVALVVAVMLALLEEIIVVLTEL
jgi:hypothetical protein